MTQQQEVIDQLIDYIDKAILKNSVSNRHVAAVLAFLNEGLKDKTIDIEELKKYFLSKTGPDETKHLLKLLGGLEVKNGIQTDTITATEDVSGKNIKAGDTVSGTNVTATDKITGKDIDITNVATILRAIFKGNISSETFVSGLLGTGWNATSEGDIEARSLLLRAFLEVPELRYNKITVIGSEFWVSEGGIIQEVAEAGENQYVVTLKLEEGDTNPFDIDDILRGIYHHNAGFRMVMFRVISVYENSTMLVMPQLTDVLPCKFMNIARMGNFTKTERQRSIYLSGKDGYIRFLDGVNSWEIAPAMVAMQLGNTKGFVHPVFGDMSGYSALLENIFMTGSIRVISADGVTAKPVPVDKGAYNAGERYYEYDRVTYGGSLYLCIAKETTETPSATSVDWLKEVSKGDTGAKGATGPQGPAGAKGATGATGPTGSQGIPGTSQYFHVKYSANSNGNPMVDTPNTYIGTAVSSSATAPTSYSSYKWVKMEGSQGPQGTQGIAGPKGTDGRTTYLHIKYSNDGKAFTANAGETPGAYIGQYTDFSEADSNTFSDYTWTKVKGETGAQGPAGAKGATGATGPTGSQGIPGTSQYFHVKYSASASGNPMVDTPNTYIGTAVTASATAPTSYTSYKWVQMKGSQGPQGTQGIAGPKGTDGRTTYLHIKYSNDGKAFTANAGETPGAYIGQYTDFSEADSNTFSDYTWTKVKGETGAQGPAGAKGATGATGPTGSQGIAGTSQYFHVKYSASASGNPMVDTPNTYIGTAVTASATAPTAYTSYKWVQLKGSQGPQGTQGIAGTKGADGRTPYLHIKYSDDGKAFTANTGETPGAYIGQYTDFTAADSTTFSTYTWSKIKGETGAKGATGATGAKGATGPTGSQGIPGTSQYFHIRYSAASTGNPMVTTPNTYIGTAVTSSATAPTAYTSYKWSQFKGSQGAQGTQGIAGTKGADGRTPYLHIKYSDNGTSFTANAGETPGAYIGQYTDFTVTDSTTFSAYTWSKIKGETGAKGPTGATGPAGAKGATGATGPTGSQGIPGTSQYFHIRYSAASTGNPMVTTPNTYIGTAVTSSATAPTAYTSYKWSQFKGSQGAQGTQGIAGTKGADGRTPYLHIKYSDNGTSFTANSGETPGAYIGQYTDFTAADSTTFSAYTWSKIKGETGAKGSTGPTGPAGAKGATGATGPTGSQGIPGTSQYFHIRYSAASTGNPMVTTPNTYIGTAVTSSATAPTAYTSYKWSQFKGSQGAQGTQGIAGTKGADGRTPYLHIKYSDNGTSFTTNSGETPGAYIGQYTDFTATDSNTFSAYTWSKIKGETGAKGPTGATGPAGAKGAVGQVGPVGPIGPKGDAGAKGATGATGATGPTGPTGPKGATGAKGDKGDAIASSYMNGVMKYADPYFRTSANSTGLYNNSGGTAGIWERLAKPAGVPGPSSYYMRYRYTVGTTSPNRGGFTFSTTTYRNCEYIARIIAKIPVGYTINYHANSQGNNPIAGWLTPNTGTGSYTEYVFRLKCSDSGTFSTSMFFSFNGANAAFTVEVAYATVFDTVANDRTTYIDSNGVYTGTLIARQITATNVVFGTANIGDATITNAKISAVDAAKISTGYLSAARIAALAITSDKIATNAITAAKIAAGTITSDKINVTSIRAAILTADAIAALTITTGKLNVTNGATIGGWKVEGNSLSIKSAASAKILVEPTGGRFLRINDNSSELLSIRADGATGINIYTQSTTGKCLIMHAQTGGMAVESYGNHIFYQRPGETWNAPGTLWAARISAGGSIENYWGNGCTASATRIGIGQYRINHDLGHLSYFVMITCTPYSTTGNKWVFGMIVEKQDRSLIVHILDTNKGNLDAAFEIAIIGRNRI